MKQIYLFRHGQAQLNLRPELIGGRSIGSPLTHIGKQQARRLGAFLRMHEIELDIVQTSPATRARDTAMLALGSERRITPYHDLLELSHGDFEGEVRAEVFTDRVRRDLQQLGRDFKLPGGESTREVGRRALSHIRQTVAPLPDEFIVGMFTHEAWIKSLVAEVEGRDQAWIYATSLANASMTLVSLEDSGRLHIDELGVETQ